MDTTREALRVERGSRIAERRNSLNMTQAELAERLDVDPMSVSRWERGKSSPTAHVLGEVARALGVSADWILTGEPGPVDEPRTPAEVA